MGTPIITTMQGQIIVRIPFAEDQTKTQVIHTTLPTDRVDSQLDRWEKLRGSLANTPAFANQTSVAVQHMLKDIWKEKPL
ncbi:MAG: hypothetical protein HYV33_04605 [Candidatus Kerfeldbacteria bacterium]|nr:hypothetical protein [Candidatus Kerfeldbacteria bacterium]